MRLYKFLGFQFLEQTKGSSKEYVFGHCFLLLCWNLVCRAGNTVSICHSHLEWQGDALRIYFAHMKNDQSGERPRDPRHVYANPLHPEVCPILSLALYWLCFGIGALVFFVLELSVHSCMSGRVTHCYWTRTITVFFCIVVPCVPLPTLFGNAIALARCWLFVIRGLFT